MKEKRFVITVTEDVRRDLAEYRKEGSWSDAVKRLLADAKRCKNAA